jgi:4-amino-4-deoxy-L-arabinose transferase-like glycosyltransferase
MHREPPPPKPVRGSVGLRVGRTRADPDELVVTRRVVGTEALEVDRGRWARLPSPSTILARAIADERVVLAVLLLVAAVLRLPNLEARGPFGLDQGNDMLALRAMTHDGVLPLLGPKASVGAFHHGALTFYLWAPAAFLSGSEPYAVVIEMVLLGLAAVAATWWMGTVFGGPVVGAIAGLLLAVSPTAVDESTFIWNPNPIPLFAALAAGAAWKAHRTGRARWWVLALGAAYAVGQLHFLGLLLLPPVLALLIGDAWQARRAHDSNWGRSLRNGLVGGLAVILVLSLPLLVHELLDRFSEIQAVLAYLTGGSEASALDPMERLVIAAFRVIAWPFVGLVTEAPIASTLVVAVTIGLLAWHAIAARGPERGAARWLAGSIAWSIVALTVAAPSLANVTPGLPNDHYHAFVDPLLVVAVAMAGVALARGGARIVTEPEDQRIAIGAARTGHRTADRAARVLLVVVLALQVGLAISRQPGPDANGGWPAARAAGDRIVATIGSEQVVVLNLPDFEPPDGIAFPIVHAGGAAVNDTADNLAAPRYLVLGCDRLFETVMLATCGGPAETERLPQLIGGSAASARLIERFDLSPRESISIYDLRPSP